MKRASRWLAAACLASGAPIHAETPASAAASQPSLTAAGEDAQRRLQQTFTNLRFENFAPSPIKGPIYQAFAGGRLLYFAPESEHLIFAAIYDRSGINLTALAEEQSARRKLAKIDTSSALAIGPQNAPAVIEFTDPDCPYCRALDRYWSAKQAEGKPVRRLILFVTGIHPGAAAKAEHILCSPNKEAAFKSIYEGSAPAKLLTCAEGRQTVEAHAKVVSDAQIGGTPTLIAAGQVISGFRQAEIEAFLGAEPAKASGKALTGAER